MQAVCSKLERDHLFVPVLPAPDKMTPNDLVLVWMHGSDDDLEAELASWTDSRGEEQAARELLAFAADGNAATRTAAITIVSRLGQAAEPPAVSAAPALWLLGFGDGHAACRARPVMSGRGSHAGWLPSMTSLSLPRFCATAALILGVASGAASLSMAWEASSSTLLTSRVPPALASSS